MDPQLRARADARLAAAAAALGLADPRAPYRERLRLLRETQPDAFERAISRYEQHVLPALAEARTDGDVMHAWFEFGRLLTGTEGGVDLNVIDATGRARPYEPPLPAGCVALLLPHDTASAALLAAAPQQPSESQQASIELLL